MGWPVSSQGGRIAIMHVYPFNRISQLVRCHGSTEPVVVAAAMRRIGGTFALRRVPESPGVYTPQCPLSQTASEARLSGYMYRRG